MKRNIWRWSAVGVVLLSFTWFLYGCSGNDTLLTQKEGSAIAEICGVDAGEFTDVSGEVLSKPLVEKFPAVKKVYHSDGLYAFILEPIAYNGPVTLALVIDEAAGETVGLRVVQHEESYDFVRDMESKWFMDRFARKSVDEYLKLVRLNARAGNEVVAITGATVTTEGVINGVNAALGLYQEYILGLTAPEVPYKVLFEPGEGILPSETESLSIRAYGLVLGEVSIDEIRELPSVKRTMSIHSTAGVTQHAFRGTLLANVLNLVDPALLEGYQWVLAVGVDDYMSGISMDEVKAENNVFVMYEDNEEPLPKKNGEPGAMRIVVLDDFFGQRFTNYMIEIILENEEP